MKPKSAKCVAKLKPEADPFTTLYSVWYFDTHSSVWVCREDFRSLTDAKKEAAMLLREGYHVRIFKMPGD